MYVTLLKNEIKVDSEIKRLLPEATHKRLKKHIRKAKSAFLQSNYISTLSQIPLPPFEAVWK